MRQGSGRRVRLLTWVLAGVLIGSAAGAVSLIQRMRDDEDRNWQQPRPRVTPPPTRR